MPNEIVKNAVNKATRQAYDDWAVAHPSLAAVIDQVSITERAAESLRNSAQYKQAVAAYHQSRNEADLLNQLANIAGPVIQSILHL
ncbi:MAG: hypothetical protein K8S55_03150 [Phycisphaerae bacterium]|nr:hypothetical protein [Phycisphaerae bacterium]